MFIEDIDHGESDGRRQKSVDGMQHIVPLVKLEVILLYFPQNFRREDKTDDDDFQCIYDAYKIPCFRHTYYGDY